MKSVPETGIESIAVNGVTLAYRELGHGYPLVLINGFASTMDTWSPPVLEILARYFRVIIFDHRGTGYSGATGDPFSISLFAGDTIALIDALGIGRAHVLGLSMGASVAQELVLAHPGRVDRLVLVAGTCGGREGVRMSPEVWARLSDKSGEPADLADRMFSILFTKGWLAAHDPWQYCPVVHEVTTEETATRQATAFFGWPGSFDRLPAIRCPVLVITGAEDAVIPPKNAALLTERIPGARLVRIPDAGHGLQYQYPDTFSREILDFLLSGTG